MAANFVFSKGKLFFGIPNVSRIQNVTVESKRTFTRLLSVISNMPDKERVKMLGPDRSCAEWLLRNGAVVKWSGSDRWQTDYNSLPSVDNKGKYFIEEIDVDEAGIMDVGLSHFDGCKHIKRIRFCRCPYLEDETLVKAVDKLKHSLQHMELLSCGDISDDGLASLTNLSLLKTLILRNLSGVRHPKKCYDMLKSSLPDCDIRYDLEQMKK